MLSTNARQLIPLLVTEWCHACLIWQLEYTLTNHTRTLTNHVVDRQAKTARLHDSSEYTPRYTPHDESVNQILGIRVTPSD